MIKHRSIPVDQKYTALDWVDSRLIDWGGNSLLYDPENLGRFYNKYSFGSRFDGVRSINHGEYAVLYERVGTKGLVLKKGMLIREINRSYYCSEAYEYPVALTKLDSGETALVHCPEHYGRIEIEEVETGTRLTTADQRREVDSFFSRFEVSPNGQFLVSAGWVWHPFSIHTVFDLQEALKDPAHLDRWGISMAEVESEVACARFLDEETLLIAATDEPPFDDESTPAIPPNHFGMVDFKSGEVKSLFKMEEPMGNLVPINGDWAWDFYDHPKIVDLNTGQTVKRNRDISSGQQNSSIIWSAPLPSIALSEDRHRVAIADDTVVHVMEFTENTSSLLNY